MRLMCWRRSYDERKHEKRAERREKRTDSREERAESRGQRAAMTHQLFKRFADAADASLDNRVRLALVVFVVETPLIDL
jgi:nucleosome binding factor SPN SPT16 subunit